MVRQACRADVLRLLEAIGVPDLGYAEIRDAERCRAARGALVPGDTPDPSAAKPSPPPRLSLLPVPLLAVVAPAPEVGRATLVANLVHDLAHGEASALAFDLDPAGDLSRFTRAPRESTAQLALPIVSWSAGASGGPRRVVDSAGAEAEFAAALFAQMRARLDERAALAIAVPPAGDGPLLMAVLGAAHRVLAVATPEQPVQALEAFDRLLVERGAAAPRWVVNRYDARHAAHRDHLAALRASLADRVLPHVVHDDAAVAALSSRGAIVALEAGESQVAAELGALAEWVRGSVSGEPAVAG